MNRFVNFGMRLLEGLIALMLAVMVVLVFGNVVLRYGFDSGITVSEEIARWLFVWLTFMGALVALHRQQHLGSDFLVSRLGPRGRQACRVLGQLAMLGVCGILLHGALTQMRINADVRAPVTGASVGIFYAAGVVFAVGAAVLLAAQLVRTLRRPGETEGGAP
jgi:TRAP-type C4-dicarboxylate transport system permease small subunit